LLEECLLKHKAALVFGENHQATILLKQDLNSLYLERDKKKKENHAEKGCNFLQKFRPLHCFSTLESVIRVGYEVSRTKSLFVYNEVIEDSFII
jgi:hypothetical protein